jgi:hypothetical protein
LFIFLEICVLRTGTSAAQLYVIIQSHAANHEEQIMTEPQDQSPKTTQEVYDDLQEKARQHWTRRERDRSTRPIKRIAGDAQRFKQIDFLPQEETLLKSLLTVKDLVLYELGAPPDEPSLGPSVVQGRLGKLNAPKFFQTQDGKIVKLVRTR